MVHSDSTSAPLRAAVAAVSIAVTSIVAAGCASTAGNSPGAGPQPFAGALFEYRLIYSEPGEGRIKAELDGAVLYLDPNPVITEADLTEVRPNITREGLILSVDMTPTAAARLRQVTGKNIGRRMALVFDSQVVSAPTIQSAVGGFAFVKVPVADPDAAATLVRKRWPPSQRE